MSVPSTASTTGSLRCWANAGALASMQIRNSLRIWLLEIHVGADATGDARDLLDARRIADAHAEPHAAADLVRDVVVQPHAGRSIRRRQVRDLDRRRHREFRHCAPAEPEEAARADVLHRFDPDRDMTPVAIADSELAAATDPDAARSRHHHHACVEQEALDRREPELEP